jgi:hypothetical protein
VGCQAYISHSLVRLDLYIIKVQVLSTCFIKKDSSLLNIKLEMLELHIKLMEYKIEFWWLLSRP